MKHFFFASWHITEFCQSRLLERTLQDEGIFLPGLLILSSSLLFGPQPTWDGGWGEQQQRAHLLESLSIIPQVVLCPSG